MSESIYDDGSLAVESLGDAFRFEVVGHDPKAILLPGALSRLVGALVNALPAEERRRLAEGLARTWLEAEYPASEWSEIPRLLHEVFMTSGGPKGLGKPAVRIEIYEHDDDVMVEVGRNKGFDEVVSHVSYVGSKTYPEALVHCLRIVLTEVRGGK